MSVITLLAQHADLAVHNLHVAGTMVSDAAWHGKLGVEHATDHLVVLAQATTDNAPVTADQLKEQLKNVQQEEQLGWLTAIGKYFIGIFQKGGEVFAGFVTGIIPTLVVLMTAFYAVTELVGEERVHGLA
ncbi:PTS glucitol/sorbitol transporter subunit IIC, partial [Mesorhizobium sp. M2A.F.Ca.ET.067.02.1.1]